MSNELSHGAVLRGREHSYIIDRALGKGAFGITYLAKYKQTVQGAMGSGTAWVSMCIKEFFMEDFNSRCADGDTVNDASGVSLVQKYRKAFVREANNLAKMQHPGIVNVFEVLETNNTVYIVMEYIDGGSLDDYIRRRGRLSEAEALAGFRQICDAMQYMHSRRMLHLDMKPKNVMRDEEGHLYLIDFGLSKQYGSDGNPESSTTIGLGTPGYAPSEQAKHQDDDKTFHATIDVYALGGTLYKMLTGQTPPDCTDVSNTMLDGGNLILGNLISAGISRPLAEKVSRAMWPSSTKRVQDVPSLIALLYGDGDETVVNPVAEPVVEVLDDNTVVEAKPKAAPRPQPQPQPRPIVKPQAEPQKKAHPKSVTSGKSNKKLWFIGFWAVVIGLGVLVQKCKKSEPQKVDKSEATSDVTGMANGHEWVDLGLPSGTKWATMNVGASSPSDYGNYYAWGETSTKSSYTWENLKYCLDTTGDNFSKYVTDSKYGNVDGKKELDPSDDAAYVNWGTSWRMPSTEQQDELCEECEWIWTSHGGHNGYKVVGPNGNSLFLPAAGYRNVTELDNVGSDGRYWSRTLDTSFGRIAYSLYFDSSGVAWDDDYRRSGLSVRAVLGS